MSTINAYNPTLSDLARRQDPDKKIATIVEVLNETNEILDDATFLEGNLNTGNKTTVRSGLPTVAWRMLNYGVQPSKSRTVQVTDTAGMLEAYAEVDKALVDISNDPAAFRFSEDLAFIEAMNQEFADTLFYGNTATDPEKFLGLAPRYNDLSSAENKGNILSGSGSGSTNTSIWLVTWGPQTAFCFTPKGSKAGLSHRDLGEVTLQDSRTPAGNYQGYRTHYKWDAGFTLRDWRYVVRIANIDVTALTKNAGSGADLIDLIVQAIEIPPSVGMGRRAIYCNKTIKSFLRRQITNKSNVHLNTEEVAGKHVLTFDGIPVRRNDAILNTESTVS